MPSPDSVVVPIGLDLGPVASPEAKGGYLYRVDDGGTVHTLHRDEYRAWRSASGDPGAPGAVWDRRRTIAAARRAGVWRARRVVDDLIRRKLVWEIDIMSDDLVLFAGLHRVEARMEVLGPFAEDPEAFEVGVPGVLRTPTSPDSVNIYLYAPTFDDLWAACVAVAEVSPTEQHPGWPKEHMLAAVFLGESTRLVASGAAVYRRAHPELGRYT